MPTKEQLAVPASMAEQLDPSADLTETEIGDEEILGHPTTRGTIRGKDYKEYRDQVKEADLKSAEASHKAVAKDNKPDDQNLTTTGETVSKDVQEHIKDQEDLDDEREEETDPKTPKEGDPIKPKSEEKTSKSKKKDE